MATGGLEGDLALRPDACVVSRTPEAALEALALARALRDLGAPGRGLRVMVDVSGRSGSAQMKWASKIQARYVIFVPSDPEGYAVRDMEAGEDVGKIRTAEAIRERLLATEAVRRTP